MIRDRNIGYRYKKHFLPATAFNCYTTEGVNEDLSSIVNVTTVLTAVDTDKYVGALTGGADDIIRLASPLPGDWDFGNDMFFRVVYSDAAVGGTATQSLTVKLDVFGFGNAITAPATALTTVIAVDSSSGDDKVDATPWGKLDGGTIDPDGTASDFWVVDIEHREGDTEPVTIIGLEVAYLPKLTDFPQVNDQPEPTDA